MPLLYFDENVRQDLRPPLERLGCIVIRPEEAGTKRARDPRQLLYAASVGAILLTADRDFEQIHDAWLTWTGAWEVRQPHPGVIRVEQYRGGLIDVATQLAAPLLRGWRPANTLRWHSLPRGWRRYLEAGQPAWTDWQPSPG